MITKLQKEYFQKSKTFLYPLLGIKRGSKYKPDNTYVAWEDHYKFYDNVIICVYNLVNSNEFRSFEQDTLFRNLYFRDFYYLPNNKVAYVFSLEDFKNDYHSFLDSSYSKMSDDSKELIMQFFLLDPKKTHYHWLNSYLHPDRYYHLYAELLNVAVEDLPKELCPPITSMKEQLTVTALKISLWDNQEY